MSHSEGDRTLLEQYKKGEHGYNGPNENMNHYYATTSENADCMKDVMFALREWYIQNESEEEFTRARFWAIDDRKLWPIAKQAFAETDSNGHGVLNESEWIQFVELVRSRVAKEGITVPPMDARAVRHFYYAFNQAIIFHEGISLNCLKKAQDSFEEQYNKFRSLEEERQGYVTNCNKLITVFCPAMWLLLSLIMYLSWCSPGTVQPELNMQSGYISKDMRRQVITPTSQRYYNCYKNNISYCDDNALQWSKCEAQSYWNEEGMVVISQKAENELLQAANELHNMALQAVDLVVNNDELLDMFYINKDLWPAIKTSWKNRDLDFQGRFDFAWDGKNPPKMLEYNADTPSLQIESSLLQRDWFQSFQKEGQKGISLSGGVHQSNYLYQRMLDFSSKLYSQCTPKFVDKGQVETSLGIIMNALDDENSAVMQFFKKIFGTHSKSNDIIDIAWLEFAYSRAARSGETTVGTKWKEVLKWRTFSCILSLYPKEWLISEQPNYPMKEYDWQHLKSFEPFWKLILGNKALLPLLWSMFPGNKYLLPAYYDYEDIKGAQQAKWVSKPVFGREGMGVFFSSNFTNFQDFIHKTESNFGRDSSTGSELGKAIYQQESDLAVAQGRVIQTSVWMIAGQAAGLAFREGKAGKHFEDTNPFLVHMVQTDRSMTTLIDHRRTKAQARLLDQIYGQNRQQSVYNNNGFRVVELVDTANNEAWKNWRSYSTANARIQKYRTESEGIVLDDIEASYIRYLHMDTWNQGHLEIKKPKDMTKVNRFLRAKYPYTYSRTSQLYLLPKVIFGKIAGYDMAGEGYWFSVDRHGVVRRHTYYSAGFGRS